MALQMSHMEAFGRKDDAQIPDGEEDCGGGFIVSLQASCRPKPSQESQCRRNCHDKYGPIEHCLKKEQSLDLLPLKEGLYAAA